MSNTTKRVPTEMDRGELENEVMQLRSWRQSFEPSSEETPETDFVTRWAQKKRKDLSRRAIIKKPVYMPSANRHKVMIDKMGVHVNNLKSMLKSLEVDVNDNSGKRVLIEAKTATRRIGDLLEEFFHDSDLKIPFEEMADDKPYLEGSPWK